MNNAAPGKMHRDELELDVELVRRLVADQFPHWAGLPLERVPSSGTDNALFRLGDDLCVRLPRIEWATGQVEKDLRWLPRLAPLLPLPIPAPLVKGTPTPDYPWTWGIYRWLPGESANDAPILDMEGAARDLARFLTALHAIDAVDGLRTGRSDTSRGVPLVRRDAETRRAIVELGAEVDTDAVTAAWDDAVRAPPRDGPPVCIHGDLLPGNLLVADGRLSAVIDFSCLSMGDPACDLMVAWTVLSADARAEFRARLDVDDAAWRRGRGWALSFGVIALPYYRDTNPRFARDARRAIAEVLADYC